MNTDLKDKVYEMYDSYNQAASDLVEYIKLRDMLAAKIKIVPFKRSENQQLLAEFDAHIEKAEAALAKEYDAHQEKCRAEEKLDQVMNDIAERTEMVYVYIKHRVPDKLQELETAIFAGWTTEEIQDFHDRVAILEATRLEELIAEEH